MIFVRKMVKFHMICTHFEKKFLVFSGMSEEKKKLKCPFFSLSGTISQCRRTSSTKQYTADALTTKQFLKPNHLEERVVSHKSSIDAPSHIKIKELF